MAFELTEWVRVHAVEGSELSQQYAGQLGRVSGKATVPGWDYTVQIEGGPEVRLPETALEGVPTDEYGDPLL